MAASAKHFSFLFCLALFSTLHAHARDSQFFSKVTTPTTTTTPAAIANPNEKVEFPNNEPPLSKQEQEPNFIPDTQNGYGLYSQETDQFPPTTTTNPASTASNLPYKTEYEQPYDDDKQAYVTKPQGMSDARFMDRGYTNNNNKRAYVTNPQGMSDTRFMDRGYTTSTNNNNYYMNKGYNTAATDNYYNGGHNYNPQQQGMSDTRFLENGRYFYDIQSENNYNNGYGSSRGVDNYNKGYYGNSYNENSYVVNNSMEGYQNQEQYQEGQEEYVP
ncbi:protein E6-like isoform X1 [Actinidia eriantha]|uniref:protein E6-like isoform X1 n=1 Tax=Actinidia eriantha TaxID=165200 RepID=UPI00258A0B67|nr:protein E6-like isoform X1 [Actinidia eriantha]